MSLRALLGAFAVHSLFAAAGWGQTSVRVTDDQLIPVWDAVQFTREAGPLTDGRGSPPSLDGSSCPTPISFGFAPYAWHGQPAPEGGILVPMSAGSPAMINEHGAIAFMSRVFGPDRNQGVFVSDGQTLTAVAFGSGDGYGGSGDPGRGVGDPSPLGGRFTGFFGGTVFAPPINNRGDVLFIADVNGGRAPRGLFFYKGDTHEIVTVAAVGDPSPVGGTLTAVGPGSMNDSRVIVFVAKNSGTNAINILKWTDGVLTKHVAVGDPAPGGGNFSELVPHFQGFPDSTEIPVGHLPGINEAGQISFFGMVPGPGLGRRGLLVTTNGQHEWYVDNSETTPIGGRYFGFWGPLLSNSGELAFYADLAGAPVPAAWFAGTPGNWRKALAFFDPVAEGEVVTMAVSRNPLRGLDACGNLLLWCVLRYTNGDEIENTLLIPPGGSPVVVAQAGQPHVLGGSVGGMNGWPTLNDHNRGMLSCYTPGAPNGILNAHSVFTGRVAGDLNCDGALDAFDIEPFTLALFDPEEYNTQYPDCDRDLADVNGDGAVDAFDIEPFVDLLFGP